VSGALFVSPDVAESFPPQCGGERIRGAHPGAISAIIERDDAHQEARDAPRAESWGLVGGDNPWEYAPAPEATDHVRIEPEYGLFIGNEFVRSKPRKTFDVSSTRPPRSRWRRWRTRRRRTSTGR
jgi:hypothetical protein